MRFISGLPLSTYLVISILWLLWQIFVDEIAEIVRSCILGGGLLMYGITHPSIIMPAILVIATLILIYWQKRQRNRGDKSLTLYNRNEFQTPLHVECNSYGYELAGKTWLQENQYLWHFNVILTNTSDSQYVSTKVVSLGVRYKTRDGTVRGYALSLIPETDKDKYGNPSNTEGKLLGENEYLNPRGSVRGFYQFLDKEGFWKPKLIQTWPMLVVVDSFDAPHRKEFSRSKLASQLSPDKEDSQPE